MKHFKKVGEEHGEEKKAFSFLKRVTRILKKIPKDHIFLDTNCKLHHFVRLPPSRKAKQRNGIGIFICIFDYCV
jgi:hypothetical protein